MADFFQRSLYEAKKPCFSCMFWYNCLGRFQNDKFHINVITHKWQHEFIIAANCKSVVFILPSRPQPQLETCSLWHCSEGDKGYCVPSKPGLYVGKRKASTCRRREQVSFTCLAPELWLRCWTRHWFGQFGALMLCSPVRGRNLITVL